MDFNANLLGPRPDGDFFDGLDLTELANVSGSTLGNITALVGVADRESLVFSQLSLFILSKCECKLRNFKNLISKMFKFRKIFLVQIISL